MISEIINEGSYIEGEKIDLNFIDSIEDIAKLNLNNLKFYSKDYKDNYDRFSYEVKDGKDYEYIDNSSSWSEISEEDADYYSMVRTENDDWFFYPKLEELKNYNELVEAEKEVYLENEKRKLEIDLKLIDEHNKQSALGKPVNRAGIPVLE